MQTIYKHRNKILVAITILMLIPFVFNIGLEWDEPFTMGLIRHSYGSIANLTAMDVHPPLYYWVLKAFLSITTFWTNSIFIKIIFARLLSLIFSLITLYYLIKILQILKLHCNNYVISFIFFMCPIVYGYEGIASSIRMYSLGAMFCTICLYYLLLFKNDDKLKYLVFICLTVTLALFTQYLIGMIAGLYILSILIILLFNKKYSSFFKLFITGVVSLILYIPWIPEVIAQFSAQSIGKHIDILAHSNIKYVILHYFLIIIMSLIIIFYKRISLNSEARMIILINILLALLILLVNVKFNPYSLSDRYTSTLLIMNYIVVCSIFLHHLRFNIIKALCVILVIALIYIDVKVDISVQFNNEIKPSIAFYNEYGHIKKDNNSSINAKDYELYKYSWDVMGGNSVYLQAINKKIYYDKLGKNSISIYHAVGNGNVKLFKNLFPNIKGYSTKPYFK